MPCCDRWAWLCCCVPGWLIGGGRAVCVCVWLAWVVVGGRAWVTVGWCGWMRVAVGVAGLVRVAVGWNGKWCGWCMVGMGVGGVAVRCVLVTWWGRGGVAVGLVWVCSGM